MSRRFPIPYLTAVFLGASLVFLIQPLFAKLLLPKFGGAPAVWNTCAVFFQTMLLFGYCYTWLATRWLSAVRQIVIHCCVLVVTVLFLPIGLPDGASIGAAEYPISRLIWLLTVSLGGPFFAVSTTTPLLQQWLSGTAHRRASDPYSLYAVSNAGSMLGLLAYPFVIELLFDLDTQRLIWSGGYAALVLLTIGCGVGRLKAGNQGTNGQGDFTVVPGERMAARDAERCAVTGARRLRWVAQAFVPSAMMLAITTRITTEVAAVPLFWVLPLAVYLATYIHSFAQRRLISSAVIRQLFLPGVFVVAWCVQFNQAGTIRAAADIGFFIVTALLLHGKLADDRPAVRYLAEFYFWIALGGCLGGVLVGVVAPVLFPTSLEWPIAVVVAALVGGIAARKAAGRGRRVVRAFALIAFAGTAILERWNASVFLSLPIPVMALQMLGFAMLAVSYWMRLSRGFVVALALVVLPNVLIPAEGVIYRTRTFFGVISVHREFGSASDGSRLQFHRLVHGTTLQGEQIVTPGPFECQPMAYHAKSGPMADPLRLLTNRQGGRRVALIGLGAGALNCLSRRDDQFDFYEIDPAIREIATNRELFTYLSCGAGSNRVIIGDGRIELGRREEALYDIILIDTFNSDSIPVHLLTAEGLDLFVSKLAEGGVLAIHISNRFLDLEPVLGQYARARGMLALSRNQTQLTPEELARGQKATQVVVISRDAEDVEPLLRRGDWRKARDDASLWTDQHSSILERIRFGS